MTLHEQDLRDMLDWKSADLGDLDDNRMGQVRHRVRRAQRRRRTTYGAAVVLAAIAAIPIARNLGAFSPTTPSTAPGSWTPIMIPTSTFAPGGMGFQAALLGPLVRDRFGCIVDGDMAVVWPKGFTARISSSTGTVEILDDTGRVVARTGQPLQLRVGGGLPPGPVTGKCVSGYPNVFLVSSAAPVPTG